MKDKRLQGQRWVRVNDHGVPCNAAKRKTRKTHWGRPPYVRPRAGSVLEQRLANADDPQ